MSTLSVQDEFENLSARSTTMFYERVVDLVAEVCAKIPKDLGIYSATERLGRLIGGTSAVAEMLGRRRLLIESDTRRNKYGISATLSMKNALYYGVDQNLLPRVDPDEAIEEMVRRDPRLAEGYRRVQDLYSKEHAFALARSPLETVTREVKDTILRALRNGDDLPGASEMIQNIGSKYNLLGWSQWYADVVFRTNLGTAYTNGRFLQAEDPDLKGFIVGFRRVEVMDSTTRKNHRAAHYLTAAPRDPIWLRLGVPGGYNCRGTISMMDRYQAERENILVWGQLPPARTPHGAYNDPGFENRSSFETFGVL